MPDKDIHVLEILSLVGATFTATLYGAVRVFSGNSKKIDLQKAEFNAFKENVAKNYPSHKAMQACSDNIARSMGDGFEKHTSDMKNVIHDAIDQLEDKLEKKIEKQSK